MRYLSVRNRAILREMVVTDFKIRYQGSLLGYLWSLLKPLFMFVILFVIFTYVIPLGQTVPHYAVQLFIGVVFWNFFNEATSTGLTAITSSGDIIRKISIPRYLLVVASSVSALINLFLNLIVLMLFMVFDKVPVHLDISLLIFPLLILEAFIFAQALAFFLSAANVKYRDIKYIWDLVLQAGFYATPIIYTATKIPEEFRHIALFNPMAQMIQDGRKILVDPAATTVWDGSNTFYKLVPLLIVASVALFASVYFKKKSSSFAEDI